jgi:hypothetical protein
MKYISHTLISTNYISHTLIYSTKVEYIAFNSFSYIKSVTPKESSIIF